MQLPDKVQTAIAALGQYDIAPDSVAPFWYRQFLRFRPLTPPPLWGASKGDWDANIAKIKPTLVTLGADPGALTAVRLSRLPQAVRGGRLQRLLYLNPKPDGSPILGASANPKGLL